jgi:hypothetical protein
MKEVVGVLRLVAATPQRAQNRCSLGTPFALLAQDDNQERLRTFGLLHWGSVGEAGLFFRKQGQATHAADLIDGEDAATD